MCATPTHDAFDQAKQLFFDGLTAFEGSPLRRRRAVLPVFACAASGPRLDPDQSRRHAAETVASARGPGGGRAGAGGRGRQRRCLASQGHCARPVESPPRSIGRLREGAAARHPSPAEPWFRHGQTLQALDRPEQALDSYDRALAADPATGAGLEQSRRHPARDEAHRRSRRGLQASPGPRRRPRAAPLLPGVRLRAVCSADGPGPLRRDPFRRLRRRVRRAPGGHARLSGAQHAGQASGRVGPRPLPFGARPGLRNRPLRALPETDGGKARGRRPLEPDAGARPGPSGSTTASCMRTSWSTCAARTNATT